MNIDDIIEYGIENSALDFKSKQYAKLNHVDFLKDIMSMANAFTKDKKLIIIGVKLEGDKKTYSGIAEEFFDSANYQQLIHANIEPDIDLQYYSYYYRGAKMGIFELGNCSNPPYMMKKDYKALQSGDTYIRKGSQQMKMLRKDMDRIIENRLLDNSFTDELSIVFESTGTTELIMSPATDIELPSAKAKHELLEKIKEKHRAKDQSYVNLSMYKIKSLIDTRSIPQLQEALKDVPKMYERHDRFMLFDKAAFDLNFMLENKGNQFIEDAHIFLYIKKQEGLIIFEHKLHRPDGIGSFYGSEKPDYPIVKQTNDEYILEIEKPIIKHQVKSTLFDFPAKIYLNKSLSGASILIKVKIIGKNIRTLLHKSLYIEVE